VRYKRLRRFDRNLRGQRRTQMTDTPQTPGSSLTEEEEKTVRSAAVRAGAMVAQAEPGFFDSFKESFAGSKAIKGASPELQKLLAGGLPEMPSGSPDEVKARSLELLTQAVAILQQKAPGLVDEFRQVVVQSAKDVANAADDFSQREAQVVADIERALAG
jgi:hypothetical protein